MVVWMTKAKCLEILMDSQKERKPYNPFHLASGYAARDLPDKKTAAVFRCLCNHSDYLGGGITVSIDTVIAETKYSDRAVCYAISVLKKLGRISKRPRGIGGRKGGRQSSVTTVYCTEAELRGAGANEENFFDKGGKHGLFKVQNEPIQSAKREHPKCKTEVFKVQRNALEPLKSEPFLPEPLKSKPLEVKTEIQNPSSLRSKEGKEKPNLEPTGKTSLSVKTKAEPISSVTGCPLKTEVAAKLRAAGCPDHVMNSLVGYTKMLDILNGHTAGGCTDPVSAYVTFAKRNKKFADMWMPEGNGKTTGTDADFDVSYSDAAALRLINEQERAKSPEQRTLETAWLWYMCLEDDERLHHGFERRPTNEHLVEVHTSWKEQKDREEREQVIKKDREANERTAKAGVV